jgi:hypothetical protein
VTKDEAQRRRWTFYEAVKLEYQKGATKIQWFAQYSGNLIAGGTTPCGKTQLDSLLLFADYLYES